MATSECMAELMNSYTLELRVIGVVGEPTKVHGWLVHRNVVGLRAHVAPRSPIRTKCNPNIRGALVDEVEGDVAICFPHFSLFNYLALHEFASLLALFGISHERNFHMIAVRPENSLFHGHSWRFTRMSGEIARWNFASILTWRDSLRTRVHVGNVECGHLE